VEGLPKVAERLDLTIFRIHQLNHSSASTSFNANFDFAHVVVVKKLVFAIIPCDPHPRPIAGCDCPLVGCATCQATSWPIFNRLDRSGVMGFDVRKSSTVFCFESLIAHGERNNAFRMTVELPLHEAANCHS
jgi:hypothetical protein